MYTCNRLTDLKGEEVGGDWERLAKEPICIYAWPMDTDDQVWGRGRVGGVGGHL